MDGNAPTQPKTARDSPTGGMGDKSIWETAVRCLQPATSSAPAWPRYLIHDPGASESSQHSVHAGQIFGTGSATES